uniref:Uncharacterized protein n=3 Tax=Triticinae TaxID=1648030 RepID=A0A453C7E7_AEGTS
CVMGATDESDHDMEKQQPLLTPAAAAADEIGCGNCKPCSCASPTATRTLSLVVLVAGALFAAQLKAREEYLLLTVFASQLLSFCVLTSLLALCALPEDGARQRLAWARAAAAQVLLWSFAMALLVSMSLWVVGSAPVAVGAALLGLALAVVFACYAELVQSLWPVA